MYDEEARNRAKLLSQRKQCTSLAIEDYVTELQVQADNYRKVHCGYINTVKPLSITDTIRTA